MLLHSFTLKFTNKTKIRYVPKSQCSDSLCRTTTYCVTVSSSHWFILWNWKLLAMTSGLGAKWACKTSTIFVHRSGLVRSYHITQQAIRFRSHHTQQHLFPRLNLHPSILSSPEGHNKLWFLCFSILMGATWKKCLIQWIFYYKNNRQHNKSYSVNKVKKAFSPLFKISQKRKKIVFLFFLIFIRHPLLLISKSTVESRFFFFHLWFVAGRSFLCLPTSNRFVSRLAVMQAVAVAVKTKH